MRIIRLGLIITLLTVSLSGAAFTASSPQSNVPYLSSVVKLDGHIGNSEWNDAAVLRYIYILGGKQLAEPATTFYLKHDGKNLLVAVRCMENEAGYPKAYPRKPTDSLSDDDAVQVVLGVADQTIVSRDVINFGGYAGATNQAAAAADHYYQFTVNAAGATSRTYNETALNRQLFKAAVSKSRMQWEVEISIPLASAGINNVTGQTIFANLFRFRPPKMTGWYIPGFGGYVPLPFGNITLLARGEESRRTIEILPAKVRKTTNTVAFKVSGDINWYPLSRCVVGEVTSSGKSPIGSAVIRINGIGEHRLKLDKKGRTQVVFDLPNDVILPCEAELTVVSDNGTKLWTTTKTLELVEQPSWTKSDAGSIYIAKKIPAPWKVPSVSGTKIELYNKIIEFSSAGLFKSVKDDTGELLSDPVNIHLDVNGRTVTMKPGHTSMRQLGNGVIVDSHLTFPGGALETRTEIDYDGFCIVKLRLLGVKPQSISHLSVRIPLRKDNARFVHRNLVQEIKELTGFGFECPAGPVWVGGHDRGISFNFDTGLFLSKHQRSQIQVTEKAKHSWMCINLVDGLAQVKDSGHIFRFFLQPTPTKRLSLRKENSFFDYVWESWSDYQGYPDLTKAAKLKTQADEAHSRNRLFGVYTCQLLAENSPGFQTYRNDLLALPPQIMYRRAFDPGLNIPCYLCCKRGPEGLLQLDGLAQLVTNAGINGIYSDGMSLAWDCENPSHKDGCGRQATINWTSESLTRVTGQRQFLKRLRGIFSESGKPFFMAAHCGGGLDINTLSFFDGYLEGEQLARFRPGYRLPLSTFSVGYNGNPWGFRTVFWDMLYSQVAGNRKAAPGWALTYALLHDTETEGASELERRIYKGFDDDSKTTFYPYWRPQPHIKQQGTKMLCSYYRKADSALLVVGNLTYDDQQTTLDMTKLFPERPIYASDIVTGETLPITSGRITLSVKPHRFCALRIDTRLTTTTSMVTINESPALPPTDIKSFKMEQWEVNAGAPGVTVEMGTDLGNGATGLKLGSIIYQAAASAKLKPPIGKNATVKLKIKRFGPRFRITLGDASIMYDWSWQVTALDTWNEGRMFQTTIPVDQPQILILSLHDGMLDATYGGQPLARDLKLAGISAINTFELSTWGGDGLEFDVLEISAQPTHIYEDSARHPVL